MPLHWDKLPHLPLGQQKWDEIKWLLEQADPLHSVLEIGTSAGHTLQLFAHAGVAGVKVRSIDIVPMQACVREALSGFDVEQIIRDSRYLESVAWARRHGPFDLVFIDANHDYDAVKADWENYGDLGRLVAFHDIANEEHGVKDLWREITADSRYVTRECVLYNLMGIGLVDFSSRKSAVVA